MNLNFQTDFTTGKLYEIIKLKFVIVESLLQHFKLLPLFLEDA